MIGKNTKNLKTAKDLEFHNYYGEICPRIEGFDNDISANKLRKEAKKWLKHLNATFRHPFRDRDATNDERIILILWILHFFNLEKEK